MQSAVLESRRFYYLGGFAKDRLDSSEDKRRPPLQLVTRCRIVSCRLGYALPHVLQKLL